MFVYIVGNPEKNVFKLGVASDPFRQLSSLQVGNPYKLTIVSKLCVPSKNAAVLIEKMGNKRLGAYEGAGGWFADVPDDLIAQFVNDHYLRSLASRADINPVKHEEVSRSRGRANLQRLVPMAKANGLTFEDVLERVEKAYEQGKPVDDFFET